MQEQRALDSRRIYYVYDISRPDTGESCYIGKGGGDKRRFYKSATRSRNPHLRSIINKYKRHGLQMIAIIVRWGLSEKEAFETEIALIKSIGRRDLRNGPLVNLTDGGDGPSGYIPKPEVLAKTIERLAEYRSRVSHEEIVARGKRAQSLFTPEELRERGRHAYASMTEEQRKRLIENSKKSVPLEVRQLRAKANFSNCVVTPEEAKRRGQKMAATIMISMTTEQRRERALKGGAASAKAMTFEQRSQAGKKGGRISTSKLTPEERQQRGKKAAATRGREQMSEIGRKGALARNASMGVGPRP